MVESLQQSMQGRMKETMPEKQLRILYVEDDRSLAASLKLGLKRYAIHVVCAYTCREAMQKIRSEMFDFYLIDVRLSDGNGFDLCRDIREVDKTPIIFLTGVDGEWDQIRGYELGGDAYIRKPFTIEGLMAIIRALLRRQYWQSSKGNDRVKSGELTIDFVAHQVWRQEEAIALTKTQFEILRLLVTHPQQVVLRDQFNSCIWEHRGVFVDQNTLTVHISNLKKAIREDGSYIETVHNIGYRWLREVEVCLLQTGQARTPCKD